VCCDQNGFFAMQKEKKPDQEPGLNLFSEENRGDRCNYAVLQASAIIDSSNVRYHEIEYLSATPVSFSLPGTSALPQAVRRARGGSYTISP
jgi:hypothetical protein